MTGQLKVGYKLSEVGFIPEDWELKSLAEITVISTGSTPPTRDYSNYGDDFLFVSPADLGQEKYIKKTGKMLSAKGFSGSRKFPENSILFTCIGSTIGKCGLAGIELTSNQQINAVFPNQSFSSEYLYYELCFISPRIKSMAGEQAVPLINKSQFGRELVRLPNKHEQRAIAAALSDMDALISGLDQLIAKKRDIKQAAMQQLLTGQTRLPGFSGDWNTVILGDVADKNRKWSFTGGPFGSNLKSTDYTADGVRIIQLQNIGDGHFIDDYAIFTSLIKADELLSCNIYPGEILLSKMGDPVARACIIPSTNNRYLMCSDGIRLCVDKYRFDPAFIFFMINAPTFRSAAENASTGSTRKRIGLNQLRNLELKCPPLKEQTTIATILSNMDIELSTLETRREKAKQIKQGMMQELLTGRIRLV